MKQRDKSILEKMMDYCLEIKDTHIYFKQNKEFFMELLEESETEA